MMALCSNKASEDFEKRCDDGCWHQRSAPSACHLSSRAKAREARRGRRLTTAARRALGP